MNEKEFTTLTSCIENGTDPVEVAEHGLLDLNHWKDARHSTDLLIDRSFNKCPEHNDCYQKNARLWKQNILQELWCSFEHLIGSRTKADFLQEYIHEFLCQFNLGLREGQLPPCLLQAAIDHDLIKNSMPTLKYRHLFQTIHFIQITLRKKHELQTLQN